jgi:hypothetical protein
MPVSLDQLINEDPDSILEMKYTVIVNSRVPYPLAMVETIADKDLTFRLKTLEVTPSTIKYELIFKGKTIEIYFLKIAIDQWCRDHEINTGTKEDLLHNMLEESSGEQSTDTQ